MKRSFADILQQLDDGRTRKLSRKVPAWTAVDAVRRAAGQETLEIPTDLSLEQCSSEATARYKAAVALQAASATTSARDRTGRILDLTGGLGVDSWAFSQVAGQVIYYERDAELAEAASRNFARLGITNIEIRCEAVAPDTELPEADLVYADPARRNAAGRKVFLLEDCTPDILTLLPLLLNKAPVVLLKLSPMADLSMLADRFGSALQEIHIVESEGEVKELLCLLRRDPALPAEPEIVVVRLPGQAAAAVSPAPENSFKFRPGEEREADAVYAAEVQPGDVLLDPCPALLKAGAFRLPCALWGLRKLAPSTHLYLLPENLAWHSDATKSASADRPVQKLCGSEAGKGLGAAGRSGEYAPVFKARRICAVLPFGSAAFKQLKQRYPQAEVRARDLPLGSEALRKRMGISPGGNAHIFGCRLFDGSAVLIVT